MDDAEEVFKMDASGLSTIKFIQRSLNLKSNSPEQFKLFIAHPKNYSRYMELSNSPGYVGKLIEKRFVARVPLRRRLIGITPDETAKRLGVGAGLLATGFGVTKLYNWFSSNDPAEVVNKSKTAKLNLQSLGAHGPAKSIVDGVTKSLDNIGSAANKLNNGLASGSSSAVSTYIVALTKEHQTMSDALKKWNLVIQNSANRNAAIGAGSMLQNTIDKIGTQLKSVGGIVGISTTGVSEPARDPNILQLQGFLKSNYKLNIEESGKLDKLTVNALKKLEEYFNKRSGDDEFTNFFVIPEDGFVINYNDFLEAGRRIAKY